MPEQDDIAISSERPDSREVRELLAERDAYFDKLYAREEGQGRAIDVEAANVRFFTVRLSGALVGCGAVIRHDGYGELKRFYVREAFRGKGLGHRLLEAAEAFARSTGCSLLRLETGVLQPAAIALYRGAGFSEIGPFGSYVADPLSLFMEKAL
jgi:putative acetyltransferase